jgi:hypothetical protein
MKLSDLVVIDLASNAGVFTAPQGITFPVAVSLIVTICRAARTMFHTEGNSLLVPIVATLAVSIMIFSVTVLDSRSAPRTPSEWLAAVAIACGNGSVLLAAALGVEKF